MEIDLKELSAILTDEEQTSYVVRSMLEDALPRDYYPNGLPDYMRTAFQQLATKASQEWLTNLFIVFKYAEFPIEKIFLNQLILNAIKNHVPRIMFTRPFSSANEMMDGYRKSDKIVKQIWESFLEAIGEKTPDARTEQAFLEYIRMSADFSQLAKDNIIGYFTEGYDSYDLIHLTIQTPFDDIFFQDKPIRPDILVWVPSEPKMKLIVDCDGFIYHSNNSTSSNNREKDRILKSYGFKVLRFSCREIIDNPLKTASELLNYIVIEFQPFVRRWIPFEGVQIRSY
jgi:Protein of unknown function (DUF559)